MCVCVLCCVVVFIFAQFFFFPTHSLGIHWWSHNVYMITLYKSQQGQNKRKRTKKNSAYTYKYRYRNMYIHTEEERKKNQREIRWVSIKYTHKRIAHTTNRTHHSQQQITALKRRDTRAPCCHSLTIYCRIFLVYGPLNKITNSSFSLVPSIVMLRRFNQHTHIYINWRFTHAQLAVVCA